MELQPAGGFDDLRSSRPLMTMHRYELWKYLKAHGIYVSETLTRDVMAQIAEERIGTHYVPPPENKPLKNRTAEELRVIFRDLGLKLDMRWGRTRMLKELKRHDPDRFSE